MRIRTLLLFAVATSLTAGGCKSSKSSNPLSPSVAGPIAGVSITAPKPVAPNAGAAIEANAQPLTLVLENASTNGQRPLNYLVEVALDADFNNKVLSKDGITPGEGQTSFKLPDPLASDRTYYWRARAQDGANTGPYSSGVHFQVFTPIVLQAPQLVSPLGDVRIPDRTPTFRVTNAARSGPVGAIVYEIQVSTNEAFTQLVATLEEREQVSSTQRAHELAYSTRYYWRARAWETTKNMAGPWSATAVFQTALAPVPIPTPTPDPVPVPGSGPYPTNGPAVVKYVSSRYPSYLVAGVSLAKRQANMIFLRDRMIDAGICGGMKLAWNLKRGGPTISLDYITYYTGGRWIGVDIGAAYDDTTRPLRLQWVENPGDTYATYGGYSPMPSCK